MGSDPETEQHSMTDDQLRFLQQQISGGGDITGTGGNMYATPSAYGSMRQNIDDFTNGPRSADHLTPGYSYGGDTMSTDRPTWGELSYPNLGPGQYIPPQASNDDPWSEPSTLASPTPPMFSPGMPSGQEMNFGGPQPYDFGSKSSDILFGGQTPNAPLEARPPGQQVDPNQGFTGGDYGQGFGINSVPNPDGGVWLYDQNWNYVGQGDSSGNPSATAYGGDPNAPAAYAADPNAAAPAGPSANGLVGRDPYSYGPPTTPEGPLTQTSQGVPDGQGGFIPGTQLSEGDAAKRYNTQAFNDPRYGVSEHLPPGSNHDEGVVRWNQNHG